MLPEAFGAGAGVMPGMLSGIPSLAAALVTTRIAKQTAKIKADKAISLMPVGEGVDTRV